VAAPEELGLDPKNINIPSSATDNADHSGRREVPAQTPTARASSCRADWICLDRSNARTRRDMVATDGQKLTLGDTTLTLYLTPGHTAGNHLDADPCERPGRPQCGAEWGGTAFNFGPIAKASILYRHRQSDSSDSRPPVRRRRDHFESQIYMTDRNQTAAACQAEGGRSESDVVGTRVSRYLKVAGSARLRVDAID